MIENEYTDSVSVNENEHIKEDDANLSSLECSAKDCYQEEDDGAIENSDNQECNKVQVACENEECNDEECEEEGSEEESEDEGREDGKAQENNDDDEKLNIELNKQVVEALLFANGEELTLQKLEEVLQVPKDQILFWIDELTKKYNSDESSFELVKTNSAYQLRTKDTYSAYIRRLKTQKPRRLSNSALETLAVIAYKQPIIKSEIERIRGVDASPTIKTLVARNLIKIIGHADKIGQPALYATTDDFLKVFNLNSLSDLPNLREVVALSLEPEEMPEEA